MENSQDLPSEGGTPSLAISEEEVPAAEIRDMPEEEDSAVEDEDVNESPEEIIPVSEDEETIQPERGGGFSWPRREQIIIAAAFWGVILLGAVLRFWGLGDKPLHHDESMHAYFSAQLMHNMENWSTCFTTLDPNLCYHYNPLLHGPFQFHIIAFVYKISQLLGVYDNGINNVTARIAAATLGTVIVGLPYFVRDRLGTIGAWLACFLLAVSPSMVYFSRFTREDIYMACFTLLLVVSVACYLRSRRMRWLIIAGAAFSLSYATKEATFLTVAVFGSFLGALLVWELGLRLPIRSKASPEASFTRFLPQTGAPIVLLVYFLTLGVLGRWFFGWLKALSIYITSPDGMKVADLYVQGLKDRTVASIPFIGVLLGIYVAWALWRELRNPQPLERRGLARLIDPVKQPLWDVIVTMDWTHWFFALLVGWTIFLILFTVLFTRISVGIGDGIWQGLYYWLQQQQVARGGQPWYYYLLLIPLYEQIGLVFGIVGVIRCLLRPTRWRLFLVYWFVGNVFIYSWASEKMPWLMIHMTMPMMLLAAIGLEPVVVTCINLVRERWAKKVPAGSDGRVESASAPIFQGRNNVSGVAGATAIFGAIMAVLLLLPTLQNMYQVTYIHPADAPHEMMIYVQTTTDVDIIMAKVDALDKKLYGGKHLLPIGLMSDATWPFGWYLRDYTNVCLDFPTRCPADAQTRPVIIAGGDHLPDVQAQFSANGNYAYHQYHMRTQWDQGYMPPLCKPTKTQPCTDPQPYVGVGPLQWLSHGDTPLPPDAHFDLGRTVNDIGLAANNVWQWWWYRKAIGATDGSYDMALLIRKDIGVAP